MSSPEASKAILAQIKSARPASIAATSPTGPWSDSGRLLRLLRRLQSAALVSLGVACAIPLVQPGARGFEWLSTLPAALLIFAGIVLTRRVERLRASEQTHLRHTEQAALAADRAKTEFLANMSHELRTPIHSVLGTTELLLGSTLSELSRQRVEIIQTSCDALLTLIEGILDFARLEAGRLQPSIGDFDLEELIEKTARILRVLAEQKGTDLHLDRGPANPPLGFR